jgi:hypothetical protein
MLLSLLHLSSSTIWALSMGWTLFLALEIKGLWERGLRVSKSQSWRSRVWLRDGTELPQLHQGGFHSFLGPELLRSQLLLSPYSILLNLRASRDEETAFLSTYLSLRGRNKGTQSIENPHHAILLQKNQDRYHGV